MNEAKKIKKREKADEKRAKQNPLGKNSKYNGGYKNIAKYSKEGREHLKLHKSANKNWQQDQSKFFKKIDYTNAPAKKSNVVPVNPEYVTAGNPSGWYSKGKESRPKSAKYIAKKEKAHAKEIRQIVNPMVARIIQNALETIGGPLSVEKPVVPRWKDRKLNQKKDMAANKEIKNRQAAKRLAKKEKRLTKK